jgi:hypothetical protein
MYLVSHCFEDDRDVLQDNLSDRPECRVSPAPYAELRRDPLHHNPKMHQIHRDAISTFGQPVVDWKRSYQDGDTLIAGDVEWVDWGQSLTRPRDEELHRLNAFSGKIFRAARRWIRKNWTRDEAMFWHGPHAVELEREGLLPTSFHPDKTTFSTIFVDRASGEQTEVIASSVDEWNAT